MFKYFNNNLSQGFVALFSGRMIQQIGYGLISLFLPIYLMINFGYRVEYVLYFILSGTLYIA